MRVRLNGSVLYVLANILNITLHVYHIIALLLPLFLFAFRMDSDQDICVLCWNDGGQMNVVGGKGLNTIMRASIEKQENDIHEEQSDYNNRNA